MNILLFILPLLGIALTLIPVVPILTSTKGEVAVKNRFILHLCMFFGMLIILSVIMLATGMVSAAEAAETAKNASDNGLKYIGAALSVGISAIGGGIAVGGATPAAIGAYSENPKTFGKAMIFVVFGEGSALYGLIISFLILIF